jgi:hypothetical protein
MNFTRRPATAAGLWNGPSMTTERCPGRPYRAFDSYLGEWTGTRVVAGGEAIAARTWLVRILDGCAVMVRTSTDDGSWEEFAVRTYDGRLRRWVEYGLDSDRRTLRHSEWDPATGEPAFTAVEPVDGLYTRTRWTTEDGGLQRIVEEAETPEGPWRTTSEMHFDGRTGARPTD